MDIQEIKDKNYNNIICITTCKTRPAKQSTSDKTPEDCRSMHLESKLLKKRVEKGDLVLFVYGGAKRNGISSTNKRGMYNLNLKCDEGYINLARKTYETIKYCARHFDFRYLYKADDTKEIPDGLCDFERLKDFDYKGITLTRKLPPKFSTVLKSCTKKQINQWARRRDIKLNDKHYDETVRYSTWKPYAISKKFAKLISKHGENHTQIYCDFLGGCEDHMIGKIWKDLHTTFNLTKRDEK